MRRLFTRTAVIIVAAAPLPASGAIAREQVTAPDARVQASNVALVGFQDRPGSAAILSGRYEEGLDESRAALSRAPRRHALELASNICAAQVKLGRLDAANSSCESALDHRPPVGTALSLKQYRAVAHVNHGVVHLVQGDSEFAYQEFSRARNLMREPHVIVGETL